MKNYIFGWKNPCLNEFCVLDENDRWKSTFVATQGTKEEVSSPIWLKLEEKKAASSHADVTHMNGTLSVNLVPSKLGLRRSSYFAGIRPPRDIAIMKSPPMVQPMWDTTERKRPTLILILPTQRTYKTTWLESQCLK
jgi:hypothetical protein